MDNKLRFDGCMATNIEQAFHHLEKVYERLITPLGLNLMEWYTLRALYAEDGVMASQLAQTVCRHPSSMTALLDRMAERGLLSRQIDADDRRSVRVFLTDTGRSYQARICESVQVIEHLLDTLVTPEQMDTFHYVLGVLQNVELPQIP